MDLMCKLCAVPALKNLISTSLSLFWTCQAGMIRAGQEEFFIEPLERGGDMTGEAEGGPGRHHIVYRSSDIKKPVVNQPADFHPRGQITFFDTSSSWSADTSSEYACWWLGRDAEVQFLATESTYISRLLSAGLCRFGAGLVWSF